MNGVRRYITAYSTPFRLSVMQDFLSLPTILKITKAILPLILIRRSLFKPYCGHRSGRRCPLRQPGSPARSQKGDERSLPPRTHLGGVRGGGGRGTGEASHVVNRRRPIRSNRARLGPKHNCPDAYNSSPRRIPIALSTDFEVHT